MLLLVMLLLHLVVGLVVAGVEGVLLLLRLALFDGEGPGLRVGHALAHGALRQLDALLLLEEQHLVHELHAVPAHVPLHLLPVREEDERRRRGDAELLQQRVGLGAGVAQQARPAGGALGVPREAEHGGVDVHAGGGGVLEGDVQDGELLLAGHLERHAEGGGVGEDGARLQEADQVVLALHGGDVVLRVHPARRLPAVEQHALPDLLRGVAARAHVLPHQLSVLVVLASGEASDAKVMCEGGGHRIAILDGEVEEHDVVRVANHAGEVVLQLHARAHADVGTIGDIRLRGPGVGVVAEVALLIAFDVQHD
mmetsp:Transcript_8141/g.16729  ORF Transcript_8141/g.16729 Transcript_8141/m.16729 type:complete len:311 (-) Transcript_8141:470-1402(-)